MSNYWHRFGRTNIINEVDNMKYYNDRKEELNRNDKVCAFYTIFTRKEHYSGSIEEFKKDILKVAELLKEYNGIFVFDKIHLEKDSNYWHLFVVLKTKFKNLDEFGSKLLKNERLEGFVEDELIKYNKNDCNKILNDYLEWGKDYDEKHSDFEEIDISEINKELKEQFNNDAGFEESQDNDDGNDDNDEGFTLVVNKSFFNFGNHMTFKDFDDYIESH